MLRNIVFFILLGVISACGGGSLSNHTSSELEPLQITLTLSDINGTVKSDFNIGEIINFTFTITNTSTQNISYSEQGESRNISVLDNSGIEYWRSNAATITVDIDKTLAPSEQLVLIVPWTIVQQDGVTAMPAGSYQVVPSVGFRPNNLIQTIAPITLNLHLQTVEVMFATYDENNNPTTQFKVGDYVKIDLRIKNNTDRVVNYSYSGFGHEITILQSQQRIWSKYNLVAVTGQVKFATIPANGELNYSVMWDGKSNIGDQMTSGDYWIEPQLMIHSIAGIDTTLDWTRVKPIMIQYMQNIPLESSQIDAIFNITDEYKQLNRVFDRSEEVTLELILNNTGPLAVAVTLGPAAVNYQISHNGMIINKLKLEWDKIDENSSTAFDNDEFYHETALILKPLIAAYGQFKINMILSGFDENLTTQIGDFLITPVYNIYVMGNRIQSPRAQMITIQ